MNANEIVRLKQQQRRQAYDARGAQPNKEEVSRRALATLLALSEYRQAVTAMWYIDCRSEVRTRNALAAALSSAFSEKRRLVVPYCTTDCHGGKILGLYVLEAVDELAIGKWGILEPKPELRGEPGRQVEAEELDFVMVPGVGFGRDGARLGNGAGYFDRLLRKVRPDCAVVAVCYESQIMKNIVMGPHDIYMDKVVTESRVYAGGGGRNR